MKTTKKLGRTLSTAVGVAFAAVATQDSAIAGNQEKGAITVQGKFYCNIKALTAAERARHKQLTEKLIRVRKEVVETEKGYEFQYGPADVTLGELAEWGVAEGEGCSFFYFLIDFGRLGAFLF